MDHVVFAGSSEGLFKTTDAGKRWENLAHAQLLKNDYVIGLGISPNFKTDQTLFVSVRGRGLFKSTNSGQTFKKIADDLLQNNHAIEYIHFSPDYSRDHTIFAASDEELFKSTDDGNAWEVIKRPVRYENQREVIQYQGKWKIVKGDDYSASSISVCDTPSDTASLNFVGSSIALIGPKAQNLGIAKIFIDGKFVANLDQYSRSPTTMTQLYAIKELSFAPHTITIEVSGARNPASQGHSVSVDALDVWP
jgi:hypothetical protein